MTAKLLNEPPVTQSLAAECAFGHAVARNECLDLGENGLLHHGQQVSRVITRTSILDAGDYTKLRELTRTPIEWGMPDAPEIDIEKLTADMTAEVERTSGRKFSLAATGGKNPDFYRNFINNGQNKRMSADVFVGIVTALGRNPAEYVIGMDAAVTLPSATVLTSTFAMLLDSLGISPFEDERAQKLAAQFPGALRRVADLQANVAADRGSLPGEELPAGDGDQPSA